MNTKKELRKLFLEKRKRLLSSYVEICSRNITQKVLELIRNKEYISFHIYTECRDGEVDTKYIIEALSSLKVNINTFSFHAQRLDTKIIQGQSIDFFDCIIVPGIVFDQQGYRIGYGAGIYDRFLANQKQAFLIGIAYDWQVVSQLPIESHDIPLNVVVSNDSNINI